MQLNSGVRSLKESWEGNRNSHSLYPYTVMGMGREKGMLVCEKNLPASAGNFFLRIASKSEKVFARILDEFLDILISQK